MVKASPFTTISMGQITGQQFSNGRPNVPMQGATPITSPIQANQPSSGEVSSMNFLSGYKTYGVAVIMIVYALVGLYGHNMSQSDAITTILQALGLGALRNGISTATKS